MFDFMMLEKVWEKGLLVYNIMNIVVVNDLVNGLFVIGVLLIMVFVKEEMDEFVKMVDVFVINIGMLDGEFVIVMKIVGCVVNVVGMLVVFDLVGVGVILYCCKVV